MERVYLLWLHDMVLDVFTTRRKARAMAKRYRANTPQFVWRTLSSDRWFGAPCRGGDRAISRLEIEDRVLR